MRRNLFALIVLALILVLFPAAIFAHRAAQDAGAGVRVIEIQARMPEAGGFSPDRLELVAGETVKLRIVSPDVVHGFLIPQLDIDVNEVYPGKPVEVTITPQKPGRFAFACTRWCSVNHWRMRGVIEVLPAAGQAEGSAVSGNGVQQAEKPPFERLGIDIDAMRHAASALPEEKPSVGRGATIAARDNARPLIDQLGTQESRRPVSPADEFARLRATSEGAGLADAEIWDLIAWARLNDISPATLSRVQTLYSRDCAACHGETGKGDGGAGRDLPGMAKMDPAMRRGPADFTDTGQMLSAPDALLQGKILRGGMGTGMPEFGSLYTDEDLWAMVSYLRTFLFTK